MLILMIFYTYLGTLIVQFKINIVDSNIIQPSTPTPVMKQSQFLTQNPPFGYTNKPIIYQEDTQQMPTVSNSSKIIANVRQLLFQASQDAQLNF